jgi:hypothetical protein
MKKYLFVLAVISVVIVALSNMNIKSKSNHLTELMLENIECLASPENPDIECYYIGTVDCPGYNIQVIYYIM